ncbi:MAG: hypothetical protein ACTSYI_08850 [Promethearchaeota archaeon]
MSNDGKAYIWVVAILYPGFAALLIWVITIISPLTHSCILFFLGNMISLIVTVVVIGFFAIVS